MLEEKNLKDSPSLTLPEGKGEWWGGARFSKTNKLIIALYMVTDIMEKDEPIRFKLRTLGVEILSDITSVYKPNLDKKIQETLSFLDIAFTIGMISQMNCTVLKKEFIELKQSIQESEQKLMLSEFFEEFSPSPTLPKGKGERENPKGLPANSGAGHSVGIQKGNTLLKALKEIKVSDRNLSIKNKDNFNLLKQDRQTEIIKIVKTFISGATITDIKTTASGVLISCGEKTLQRELVSMVKDSVLKKTGEKRWSRYSIK